jgi:hypothetical protein
MPIAHKMLHKVGLQRNVQGNTRATGGNLRGIKTGLEDVVGKACRRAEGAKAQREIDKCRWGNGHGESHRCLVREQYDRHKGVIAFRGI